MLLQEGKEGVFCFYSYFLEIKEVMIMPRPKPSIIQATNAKGLAGKKKNPAPIPAIRPPPIAQSLLSIFFDIVLNLIIIPPLYLA